MKKLLSLGKYVALLPLLEPIIHDGSAIVDDLSDGKIDDPQGDTAAALDIGRRVLKAIAWVKSHGQSA